MKTEPTKETLDAAKAQKQADTAAMLARVFLGSDDGKRALSYLRERFGHKLAFRKDAQSQRYDSLEAAIRDGERRVMEELEAALHHAAPQQWAESLI